MAGENYPSLSELVTVNQLPDSLEFLHQGLSTFLDGIFYREFYIINSQDGASFSVFIELLSKKGISVELPPATGFRLILNPDYQPGNMSLIPLSFTFSWGILRFIKDFNLSSFDFSPTAIYQLIFPAIGFTETDLIFGVVANSFANEADPLSQLATELNTNYNAGIPSLAGMEYDEAIETIIDAVTLNTSEDINAILYNDYINDAGNNESRTLFNLGNLFNSLTGGDLQVQVQQLVTPSIRASVELSAGLEIPRSLLLPMKPDTNGIYDVDPDTNVKSTLLLGAGDVYFDSRSGQFSDRFRLSGP